MHPYLTGNRAPVTHELPLTPCRVVQGHIPEEMIGGIYVRNGSNPAPGVNIDKSRNYHMFDGDGMLAGVYFDPIQGPAFTSRWIQTDVLRTAQKLQLSRPVFPSITTLINPSENVLYLIYSFLRTLIVFLLTSLAQILSFSRLHGLCLLKRVSVANTAIMWWDRMALATCESGPPMRIALPELETKGWWPLGDGTQEDPGLASQGGIKAFFEEWTTAHPHVDPITNEFIAFHSSFSAPYIFYSVLPPHSSSHEKKLLRVPIPGLEEPRMMHDFGVSLRHTFILDFPLSLRIFPSISLRAPSLSSWKDLANLAKHPLLALPLIWRIRPTLTYSAQSTSRIGVLPRYEPEQIRWYTLDRKGGCVFHTVNAWDDEDETRGDKDKAANLLVSRMGGDNLVWTAGNIKPPTATIIHGQSHQYEKPNIDSERDECLLYYYRLPLHCDPGTDSRPSHAFPLLSLPFEFSTLHPQKSMRNARWVWGCSLFDAGFDHGTSPDMATEQKTSKPSHDLEKASNEDSSSDFRNTAYTAALSSGFKIDCLAKVNVHALIERGIQRGQGECVRPVDTRSPREIWETAQHGHHAEDIIKVFKLPQGWYAQEVTFVPRQRAYSSKSLHTTHEDTIVLEDDEDDGYLLTYVFDENQLKQSLSDSVDENGGNESAALAQATSELWIIDARTMSEDSVTRIALPQRVPYGLHGEWFARHQVEGQIV